jgi:hypothetical protein
MVMKHDRTKNSDVFRLDPRVTQGGQRAPLRRLLKELGGIELWQIEGIRIRGYKWPAIQYEVAGDAVKTRIFSRPHEAWTYFQQLANAYSEPPPAKHRRSSS